MRKTAIFAAICIALLATFILSRDDGGGAVRVRTEAAERTNSLIYVEASGALEPYRTRRLGAAGYAVAERIFVNVGDPVAEGQVIMTFEAAESPAISADIGGMLSSADIEAALGGDIAGAAESVLAEAFSAGEIVSPFDGIVTAISLAEGEQASPFEAVAEVSDLSRIRARVKLGEQDFSQVEVGMPAGVTSGGVTYDAVVIEVSPLVRTTVSLTGSSERYCEAVLELYLPEGASPGSSASAVIYTERRSGVITLPFAAIEQDAQNREYVFVNADGVAKLCFVATGKEMGERVEILSGVDAGDEVIVYADGELQNGTSVEVE